MSHHELDARGLLCPMPVIRMQKRVRDLAPGDTIEVVCTDPGALNDIPAWARINGHTVLDTARGEGEVRIRVRVETPPEA